MAILKMIVIFGVFILIYCSSLNMSTSEYYKYYNDLNERIKNKQLTELMNGHLMNNVPNINLFVNNHKTNKLMKCTSTNAVFLRDVPDSLTRADIDTNNHAYDSQCQQICKSGSAKALLITDGEEVYMNNTLLNPGVWCVVDRPRCNLRTTYAVMTANGDIVCRSKFPNLFGGPTGDKVIACNNNQYFNHDNKLIDNKTGESVDPQIISLSHENETIVDKNGNDIFRFTCSFANDDYGNQYIEHPLNRFHPFRNPCTIKLVGVGKTIPGLFNPETVECDCSKLGDIEIKNELPHDKRSTCTRCMTEFKVDIERLQIGSVCFTADDPAVNARHQLPCSPERFNTNAARCDVIKLGMKPVKELVDSDNKLMIEFEGEIEIDD